MDVFKETHPEYNNMVSLFQNEPSLDEPHVILTPLLQAIKKNEKFEIK